METQNPDYKYYRLLAGTWKSYDGACTATLTATVGITVSYGGASMDQMPGVSGAYFDLKELFTTAQDG